MKRVICLMSSLLIGGSIADAGGFMQANQSASGAGVANAYVATAADASAIAYNPSGIAWQSGISINGGLRMDFRRDSWVKLPAGNIGSNDSLEPTSGFVYASWVPQGSRWAFGFGFAPMYQANNDWTSAFAAASGNTELNVDRTSFDGVYAINSNLAIGLGADWYISRANLTQGTQFFKGDDFASFGGHLSVMWKPQPAWQLGLLARSGSNINMSGQANNQFTTKLPDEVTVGVAHDFADVVRVETDVKWTRWSALKDMSVTTGGVVTQANPLNLKDTITVMAGLTWTWRPDSQLRFGYAYDQGANKAAGFNPIIADQDGHRGSIGLGGNVFGLRMDMAYTYTYYSKKTATGTYAGTYRDRRHSLILAATKNFD